MAEIPSYSTTITTKILAYAANSSAAFFTYPAFADSASNSTFYSVTTSCHPSYFPSYPTFLAFTFKDSTY